MTQHQSKGKWEANVVKGVFKKYVFSTINGHMVQNPAILDDKRTWHPPLGHRRKTKESRVPDRLEFLCVRSCYIILPSSVVDFVPCDQLVQNAHSNEKEGDLTKK